MKKYTVEEKYQWLCERLKISDIDYWEGDALLTMPKAVYFGFSTMHQKDSIEEILKKCDIDRAIELAMEQSLDGN